MNVRRSALFFLLLALVAFFAGCAPARPAYLRGLPMVATPYSGIPVIRVLIVDNASPTDGVTLAVSGECSVYRYQDSAAITALSRLSSCRVIISQDAVYLGSLRLPARAVEIVPAPGAYCTVNGIQYDGNIALIGGAGGTIKIVNAVDLESYVKGVVGSEVPYTWPSSALQTQAVAARTYALWKIESGRNPVYDVVATVSDQVYTGRSRRRKSVDRAGDDTMGVVLLWKGRLFPTYYHSSSGGYTENAFNVWHTLDIPPLAGGEVPSATPSPHSYWKRALSPSRIEAALTAKGHEVSRIRDVIPEGYTPSGRPTHVRIVHDKGELRLTANSFRLAVGAGSRGLKSTRFRCYREGDNFVFFGSGFGHGVGMDQYAIRNMAEKAMDCLEILTFFYPRSEPLRAYK